MMGLRRSKAPPKTIPTVRTEIQALEQLAEKYRDNAVCIELHRRIMALRYALTWQQGRASQRPSKWVQD